MFYYDIRINANFELLGDGIEIYPKQSDFNRLNHIELSILLKIIFIVQNFFLE